KEMVRTWAPSLAWLLPTSTSTEGQESTAATSAELVQQFKPVALDLAIVRHSLEQLATKIEQLGIKQEQMAQNIATLRANFLFNQLQCRNVLGHLVLLGGELLYLGSELLKAVPHDG
ncbi:MAG: hypothetical protein WCD13_07165, partial [Pseudolabrys sp.]